jgi:hypothetical protein
MSRRRDHTGTAGTPMPWECLGTVTEAAETLGTDAAGVWESVATGRLRAERRDESCRWTIYRPTTGRTAP